MAEQVDHTLARPARRKLNMHRDVSCDGAAFAHIRKQLVSYGVQQQEFSIAVAPVPNVI